MLEIIVLDYLSDALKLPVYMETPESNTDTTWVRIEKTGGSETNHLKRGTLAIQSYAPTLYEAASLNEAVKAAMSNIITLDEVSSASLNSDYNYTNEAKKEYRYQAVYDLVYFD